MGWMGTAIISTPSDKLFRLKIISSSPWTADYVFNVNIYVRMTLTYWMTISKLTGRINSQLPIIPLLLRSIHSSTNTHRFACIKHKFTLNIQTHVAVCTWYSTAYENIRPKTPLLVRYEMLVDNARKLNRIWNKITSEHKRTGSKTTEFFLSISYFDGANKTRTR